MPDGDQETRAAGAAERAAMYSRFLATKSGKWPPSSVTVGADENAWGSERSGMSGDWLRLVGSAEEETREAICSSVS